MPSRPINATAASLLGFLHQGPLTGWDLVAVAQERIGEFWTLTQSQVYRELAAMAAAGLVEAGTRGRRDRKPYRITDDGRAAFAEWVDRDPGHEQVRVPLLLTVAFAAHLPPGRLAEILAAQRARHAERLAGYEAIQRHVDDQLSAVAEPAQRDADHVAGERSRLATLDFGLRYERAVLEWFDRLPTTLGVEPAGPQSSTGTGGGVRAANSYKPAPYSLRYRAAMDETCPG